MFVYQNKDGHICVTFTANKPVEAPEYVIAVDDEAKALYMVSGEIGKYEAPEAEDVEETVKVEVPPVEVLDTFTENDAQDEVAPKTVADATDAPVAEPDDRDTFAPVTEANNDPAPTVEELDSIVENDPPKKRTSKKTAPVEDETVTDPEVEVPQE